MKAFLVFAACAAAVLSVTPASARGGGFPNKIMPSYPHATYCERCVGFWDIFGSRRSIGIRRHLEHGRRYDNQFR